MIAHHNFQYLDEPIQRVLISFILCLYKFKFIFFGKQHKYLMITAICFIGLIILFKILKGKEGAQW